MSKVFIEETTLSAIGAAIREKTGKSDLIAPGDMPAEIRGIVFGGGSEDCNGLHLPEEGLVITGDCSYRFANGGWDWFIDEYGNRITTTDIVSSSYMFQNSKVANIPFDLNYWSTTYNSITHMFDQCSNLEAVPKMINVKPGDLNYLFIKCSKLRTFPDGFAEDWNWDYMLSQTEYGGGASSLFNQCSCLRAIPKVFLKRENIIKKSVPSYSIYYSGFYACTSLEELDLPVYNLNAWTSNGFNKTFEYCSRLKKLTFNLQEDGSPYVIQWKNQTIDLSESTGYGILTDTYNSDFTNDNKITTEEQWRGYINGTNPDGWSNSLEYSTFGKTAATELINTLPDSSAYGTNTVKFKANAASAIPGENVSELSEEVIAAAAAKGWTVAFA